MRLLAFDTSTNYSSIALCSEDELYGEYTWSSRNNHSVELLEYMQRLLKDCQIALAQLDAIAVATGPGSFNGLRVAVATAKTLAYALRKPLIGVNTLEIIANKLLFKANPICPILEAGRSEVYAACYRLRVDEQEIRHFTRISDYLLSTPENLATYLEEHLKDWLGASESMERGLLPPYIFCGEISAETRRILSARLPDDSLFLDNLQATRRASELALLAWKRLHNNQVDDPLQLEPHYGRRPSITTSTRKQPLLSAT